jgi:hypothetical protein
MLHQRRQNKPPSRNQLITLSEERHRRVLFPKLTARNIPEDQEPGKVFGMSVSAGAADRRNPEGTDDLADFVLARNAERERLARTALPHYTDSVDDGQPSELVAFRKYNDPTFVLLQCDAIRQVVELHRSALEMRRTDDPYQAGYIKAMRDDRMLRLIALPYAGHPDYRPEWGLTFRHPSSAPSTRG